MERTNLILLTSVIVLTSFSCSFNGDSNILNKDDAEMINNVKPKHLSESNFIKINRKFDIPLYSEEQYLINNATWIDVDKEGNIYILDLSQRSIFKFDSSGVYKEKIPRIENDENRLNHPEMFYLSNDKFYVFEQAKGVKILDIEGNFIKTVDLKNIVNAGMFLPIEDYFIGYSFSVDASKRYKWSWLLAKYSNNLSIQNEISRLDINRYENPLYDPYYMLIMNSENHLFLMNGDADNYKVSKFNVDGKKLLSFGRKYERTSYSKEVIDYYNNAFKNEIENGQIKKIPQFPPIIRNMYVDKNDYIWVVIGESNNDIGSNSNLRIKSTVDIFDKTGNFLYTLESDLFGYNTYLIGRKLYVAPKKMFESSVIVYDIQYKFEN